MSSVDNRIVKMGMENGQFMSAAKATMNTLNHLSESLKLSEGVKGLENLASKAKNVDLSTLGNSVDSVRSKFSALEIAGITALANITNKAVDAGLNFVKSLTVDPVLDGLSEYETKMGAIQTIMTNTASKGTTLDDVNKALGELNVYSDKTIYNFAQMTDNIGKMTAAGVGLNDATKTVKGLANVAAGFGVDATKMAGATYQMSQALAAGSIRLEDWNSLSQAGMGGDMIQKELIKTAEGLGIFVDKSKPFRLSLESNWLSSKVFTDTMGRMADDPALMAAAQNVTTFTKLIGVMKESVGSGWAVSWEKIFGSKDQSTALFTGISNGFGKIAGAMADYRNAGLELWNTTGGRDAVLKGFLNIFTAISKILGPIYESFQKIIDPYNGERLVGISKGFEAFTSKLIISDKASAAIGKTFDLLFTAISFLGLGIKPILALFNILVILAKPFAEAFINIVGSMSGMATSATLVESAGNKIDWVLNNLTKVAEYVSSKLGTLFNGIGSVIQVGLDKASPYIEAFKVLVGSMVAATPAKLGEVKAFVTTFVETYKPMEKAKEIVTNSLEGIQYAFTVFMSFLNNIKMGIKNVVSGIGEDLNNIKQFFVSIVDKIKGSNIQGIDLVNAGLFASLLLVCKKLIPMLKNFFGAVGNFKDSLIGVLDSLQGTLESYQKNLKADMIQKIAIAIGILAVSIFILSKVDPTRLLPAVAALGALVGGMLGAMKLFEKIDPKSIVQSGATIILLIGMAIALNKLASAMVKLGNLKTDQIIRGIVGLGASLIAMVILVKSLDGANITPSQAKTILLMASSLWILAGALAIIGNLENETILRSLTTIAIVLAGLTLFFKAVDGLNPTQAAKSIMPIALSLVVLGAAMAIIGNLETETILRALITMGVFLTGLQIFLKSLDGINPAKAAVSILPIAFSMLILAGALAILGNMDPNTLMQGGLVIAAALLIFSLFVQSIGSGGTSMVKVGFGILLLSGALYVLAGVMQKFGEMSLETIGKGLLAIAGVLIIFGLAALALQFAVPAMLAVALGLAAMGLAVALIGGSMMILSIGITMLAGSIVAGGVGIAGALIALCAVIPVFAAAVALGLVSFITILGYNAEAIGRALTSLIAMMIQVIITNIPLFVQSIVTFLMAFMDAIITLTPKIIETVVTVIMAVMEALTTNLPKIADMVLTALLTLITQTLESLIEATPKIVGGIIDLIVALLVALAEGVPKMATATTDLIVAIIQAWGEGIPRVVDAAWDFVIKMIDGLTNTIETKMPEVRAAAGRLVTAIIDEFIDIRSDMAEVAGNVISGLANGIWDGIEEVKTAASDVGNAVVNAFNWVFKTHSPSRVLFDTGKYVDQGLANGMSKYSGVVEKEAVGVGNKAVSGISKALSNMDDLWSSNLINQPTIRPIMDMSDVQAGLRTINDLVESDKTIDLADVGSISRSKINNVSTRIPGQNDNGDIVDAIKDLKKIINNAGGDQYNLGDITYDDGSNVSNAIKSLVRATKIERRI